jgi:peptidyl-prolyl cis-trans isomerase C
MKLKLLLSTCVLSCALLIPIKSFADSADSIAVKSPADSNDPVIAVKNSADSSDPVAIVNDEIITQQDYQEYLQAQKNDKSNHAANKGKIAIEELVQRELLKQDALKQGLDKHPEFIRKLNYMRNNLLMAMGLQNYLEKHPITDEMLKAEYDKQIAQIKMPKEYKVQHILVKTEAEAKAIITELEAGKSFGDLAKKKSIDIGSGKQNGELGWITKAKVVPGFGNALDTLEKGKYSTTPVKSQFGWHIIQLDDVRSVAPPSFETVKSRIQILMQNQLLQQYMSSLIKPAKIEIIKPKS